MRRFLIAVAVALCATGAIAGPAHGTPPPGIHKSGAQPSATGMSTQNIHKTIVP